MCQCIEHERAADAVLQATHDVVVHVKGGGRYGRRVKLLGAGYAAEVTGHTEKHLRNCLDVNQETHQLTLRAWHLMLLSGMDTAPLEELCRSLDGFFCRYPAVEIDEANPERSLAAVMAEVGDISRTVLENCDKHGPGGEKWTRRERENFDRQVDEALCAILKYKKVAHAVHAGRG